MNLAQTGQVSDLSEIRKEVDPDNSLSNEELNEIQKQANLESGLDQNGQLLKQPSKMSQKPSLSLAPKGSLHISLDKTVGGIKVDKQSNTINPFDKEFNNE